MSARLSGSGHRRRPSTKVLALTWRERKRESIKKERLDFNRYTIMKQNVQGRGDPAPAFQTAALKQTEFLCFFRTLAAKNSEARVSQFSRTMETVSRVVHGRQMNSGFHMKPSSCHTQRYKTPKQAKTRSYCRRLQTQG